MPVISPDLGYLTVLNLFRADSADKQVRLLGAMREIVNHASYDGWVSSTVHSGQAEVGTANLIQWSKAEGLEQRYASDEFKHQIPLFTQLTTSVRLLQTYVSFTQRRPELGGGTEMEVSPTKDDLTVIEVFAVAPQRRDELVDALGAGRDWLLDVPGYRAHSVLRGKALRGKAAQPLEGAFVVSYAQWESDAAYEAFRTVPAGLQTAERRRTAARLEELVLDVEHNTYRVVHTRSTGGRPVSAAMPV